MALWFSSPQNKHRHRDETTWPPPQGSLESSVKCCAGEAQDPMAVEERLPHEFLQATWPNPGVPSHEPGTDAVIVASLVPSPGSPEFVG